MLQARNRPADLSDMEIPLTAATAHMRYIYHTCPLPPRMTMYEIPDYPSRIRRKTSNASLNRRFWLSFLLPLAGVALLAMTAG